MSYLIQIPKAIRLKVNDAGRFPAPRSPSACAVYVRTDPSAVHAGVFVLARSTERRVVVAIRQAKVAVVTFALLAGCLSARAEVASIYGNGLCGHLTASGEHFDCSAMTAAHRSLPFGTLVKVCHDGCVTVRINDRGVTDRLWSLEELVERTSR